MHRSTVLLLVALAAVLLSACSEMRNGTGLVSKRIGDLVHTPGVTEVDLAKLTSFGWQYFYVSRPGVTREEVCRLIGAGRSHCGRVVRIEKAPEDHVYLIFGLDGQLTHIELHALENGRFDLASEGPQLREHSIFRVRRPVIGPHKDVIVLEPK